MRPYNVTVIFEGGRIKPRLIAIAAAASRKDARRQARAIVAEKHPTWKVASVSAAHAAPAPAPAAEAGPVSPTSSKPKRERKADPLKQLAWSMAEADHPVGSGEFWDAYRALKKDLLILQAADATLVDA